MRFIHCADIHLNSEFQGLPYLKANQRREEIFATFEYMVDFARLNSVDAVIIAGDLFDTACVSDSVCTRVLSCIEKCSGVDFLYLPGNHEKNNVFNQKILPSNLKVFGDTLVGYRYGEVTISGIKLTEKNVRQFYDETILSDKGFNVLVMHGQVVEYGAGGVEDISLAKLKDKNIDYLALGHVHSFYEGQIGDKTKYAYSGCLDGRGYDELGQKGFILCDVDVRGFHGKFINSSSRIYHEFNFDVSKYSSWFDACAHIIENMTEKYSRGDVVKVVLNGSRGADFYMDVKLLEEKLNQYFFYSKVQDKTRFSLNKDEYLTDKSLRGEFVRSVLSSVLTDEQKDKVISCGLSVLQGERI